MPAGDVGDDVPHRPRPEPDLGHLRLVQPLQRLVQRLVLAAASFSSSSFVVTATVLLLDVGRRVILSPRPTGRTRCADDGGGPRELVAVRRLGDGAPSL